MKVGFFGALTIVFIVLKLTEVIAWSWWLVLLPLWGWLALLAVFMVCGAGIVFFKAWRASRSGR